MTYTFRGYDNCANCTKLCEKVKWLVDLNFEGAQLAECILNYRATYRCLNKQNGDFQAQEEMERTVSA